VEMAMEVDPDKASFSKVFPNSLRNIKIILTASA